MRGNRVPLMALLVLVAGLSLTPMAESDLFFRIKTGQEILAHHALLGRNLFSFTYPDYPDLDTAWLFEVAAAALYARRGWSALVVAKTAVLLGVFAGAFALCRRRGAGPVATALALAGAAWAGHERFVERPHLFSLAGVVVVLAAVDALAAGGRARRIAPPLLAAVVLWANLHAGVFLAVALLALAAAGAAIDARRGLTPWGLPALLALLAAGAAAATLVTPVGAGLYRYLRLHTVLTALHPVDEFRAASWISDAPLLLYMLAVTAAALIVRPVRWTVIIPVAALAVLALRSVRFGADLALVGAPLLASGLCLVASRLAARAPRALRRPVPAVAVCALLLGLAVGPRLGAARQGRPPFRLGLDDGALPLDAIRFAEENGLRDRMYNDFEIGSYLLFEGFPRHRVFVDPRLPAYPPQFHQLLGRADLTRAAWGAAMLDHGVTSALLAYAGINRRVAWWDPADWALVYRGGDARLFVRRLPRYRALIAAREIPATFTFTLEEGTVTHPLEAPPPGSPVPACEWQRRLGDLLFDLDGGLSARGRQAYQRALAAPHGCLQASADARLAGWVGALELGDGHAAAALALFERALAEGDGDITTRANRALALEGLGRATDAAAAWADVAARAAGTPLGERARAREARNRLNSPSAPPPTHR